MRSFSYTPGAGFREELILLTLLELDLVRNFPYTPPGLVLVRSFSYTPRKLVLVRSFSYTPRTAFSEDFFLTPFE